MAVLLLADIAPPARRSVFGREISANASGLASYRRTHIIS